MLIQLLEHYRGVRIGAAAAAGVTTNVAATTSPVTTQASGSNFLVMAVGQANISTGSTITDNKGNGNYPNILSKHINSGPATGNSFSMELYYLERGAGGAGHTFTATDTAGSSFDSVFAVELIGAAASSSLDSNPGPADDQTSPYGDAATGATASHNGICVSFIALANNTGNPVFVPGGAFVKRCAVEDNSMWCGAIATATIASGVTLGCAWTLQTAFTSDSIVANLCIKSL